MTKPPTTLASEPLPVKVWPAVRKAAAVSTALWLFMLLTGFSAIEGIREQHVAGFPNDGQLRLYVVVPLGGLACSAAILGFTRRLPSWARRLGVGIGLLALLPVFMLFSGGV